MLSAYTDLEIRPRASAPLDTDLNELTDTLLIENLEGVLFENTLVDVFGKEHTGIIPGITESHLGQVIGAE